MGGGRGGLALEEGPGGGLSCGLVVLDCPFPSVTGGPGGSR